MDDVATLPIAGALVHAAGAYTPSAEVLEALAKRHPRVDGR